MGDFFLDAVYDRIREFSYQLIGEAEAATEIPPEEWQCLQVERRAFESQYLKQPYIFFQERAELERCRARRDPAPAEAISTDSLPDFLDQVWDKVETLGLSAEHYLDRGIDIWRNPPSVGYEILKQMLILGLGGGSSKEDEIRKTKDGEIRGSFHFRGKKYELKTKDDKIIVNGRAWKFEGTTAKTEAASIRVENLVFDEAEETLQLEIVGSIAFFEERVNKTFQGDQVEKMLDSLANGDSAIATPEMEAKGIRLIPADVS